MLLFELSLFFEELLNGECCLQFEFVFFTLYLLDFFLLLFFNLSESILKDSHSLFRLLLGLRIDTLGLFELGLKF